MNTAHKKWMYGGLMALLVLGLLWGGWRAYQSQRSKAAQLAAQRNAPVARLQIAPHEWMTVTPQTLPLQVRISGSLQAVDSSIIKARVSGELRDLQLREGDTVRKGQIIARVDATESEARYRQAQLQAQASQAQVTIQQRQYDNNRALVDKQFISPTALATSQANLQAAQANHAAAQAATDAARKVLEDTVLRSPIEGQVSRRWVHNGERVNVEAQIMEVVNTSALELVAQLTAQDSLHVRVGQTAQLRVEGSLDHVMASVVRISPSAQDGNRSVPAYLRITAPGGLQLRPGMFVEGNIQTGEQSGLAIPLSAVRNDQPSPYVQTVENQIVQRYTVQLGAQSTLASASNAVWVLVQGVPQDSQLLLGSVGMLPEGTPVQLPPASSTGQRDLAVAPASAQAPYTQGGQTGSSSPTH